MTQEKTTHAGKETRALRSTALSGGEAPTRVLLAPWGSVESTNGSFVVDEEASRLVIESFVAHATDLPIDFEHQTLGGSYASPSGQAPAAGWIKSIVAEPGVGLLADIEWTSDAARMLVNKEYRYLSPVAVIRKSDRRVVGIHSAALTNKPAIRGMSAIVNRELHADEAAHVEFAPMARLCEALQLDEESDVDVVLAAAGRRIADLEEGAKRQLVEERIAEAMRVGKLVEAQRAWAEALVAKESGLFDEWLATAPIVVPMGRSPAPSTGLGSDAGPRALATRVRSEFRSNPLLARLTSEDAYVACCVREAKGI